MNELCRFIMSVRLLRHIALTSSAILANLLPPLSPGRSDHEILLHLAQIRFPLSQGPF